MDPKRISRYLGVLIMVLGGTMISGVLIGALYDDLRSMVAYAASTVITLLVGGAFRLFGRERDPDARSQNMIMRREALVVVTFIWLFVGVLGGLPYMLDGTFDHFADAFFESVSGFTTTGSTVLTEIEGSMSRASHFWRCLTHWLGGMGIVVLFVAIFPQLGVGGKHLFKTEVPGPITEGLRPKTRETSKALWLIYIGLTLINAALLWAFGPDGDPRAPVGSFARDGMDWYHAVCHAFSTLATGGFSTRNGSMGDFASLPVDVISTAFMFLAGVNFSLYYLAFQQRSPRRALRDRELWTYTLVTLVAALIVSLTLWMNAEGPALQDTETLTWLRGLVDGPAGAVLGEQSGGAAWRAELRGWIDAAQLRDHPVWQSLGDRPGSPDYTSFATALRYGAFQVVAVMTTTGFGTDNFDQWSPLAKLLLAFLMFMGGCAGSTAGGLKVFRVLVMVKAIGIEVRRAFRPEMVRALRVGRAVIPPQTVHTIVVFFGLFMIVYVLATLFVAAYGHDIVTSATASIACLASIGPGLGQVNGASNFAFFEAPVKVMLSLCMILGRLELFTFMVLLLPSFWRR